MTIQECDHCEYGDPYQRLYTVIEIDTNRRIRVCFFCLRFGDDVAPTRYSHSAYHSVNRRWANAVPLPSSTRLEEAQALGFKTIAECDDHQEWLAEYRRKHANRLGS